MGKSILLGALASLLLSPVASASAQSTAETSPATEENYKLPPLQFSAVDTFVDAIGIEDEAALTIDPFWQPAIAALIAANPDKAELARSFGSEQRRAELTAFRPLVAMMLDSRAVELLNPETGRRLEELLERNFAEVRRAGTLSRERDQEFAREALRIRSGPAARVNGEFEALAKLALTADGIALRQLFRRGYFWCARETSAFARSQRDAECAQLEKSAALKRLRKARLGEKLILVNGTAYAHLMGMISMAHAPGIRLYRLLPPKKVGAAGLSVPADQSFEELVSRYTPSTGRGS